MTDTTRAPYGADQGSSMMGSVTEKAGELLDQAKPTLDTGMEKAASGLETAAETLRERGEAMGGGQMASVATLTADKLTTGAEMLRGTSSEAMMVELENMVRRKPVESLAVAAAVGFVLSKAIR
jgi:ElaB/YqjD/DUF883 family membrane-anchored ribosome-binding protein